MISVNDRCALTFSLSPGNAHDAVEGCKLLSGWKDAPRNIPIVMDRAYEGDETRQYNKQIYKRRNEIERLFRRLKGFRCIFSRFEKLDIMFKAFINFALIINTISVNAP